MDTHSGKINLAMSQSVRKAYQAGQEDEAMEPFVLHNKAGLPIGRLNKGDYVIFYDLRGEREIELTESLTNPGFSHFPVKKDLKLHFVTMIQYDEKLDVRVAFPPIGQIEDTLSQVISNHGLRQVKIAESEKAIHVCFFLNGKIKEPFAGEQRIVIPSPDDQGNYENCPLMSVSEVANATIEQIRNNANDVIITNFANVDVIGHTENRPAILQAIEGADKHAGMIIEEAMKAGMDIIVTADHGTVEKWLYPDGSIDTGHTRSLVPFFYIPSKPEMLNDLKLRSQGELADVAPTILQLLGIAKPAAMDGESLILDSSSIPEVRRRIMLLILDGWGLNDDLRGNLIAEAKTPVMDKLQANYPMARLRAAGEAVGMPENAVGNSEAGHLHLGCGRRIYSDRVRIDRAIKDGSFYTNETFLCALQGARKDNKPLHLLGIVSFYSSHGSLDHFFALLKLAKEEGVKEVYIHSLLGRRGEKPESGAIYINKIEEESARLGLGRVVTVMGRYWALDREFNWDRIEKTYRALIYGEGNKVRYA
jgi:2,3-bisphosphoglycerate-independent phosphoglycerate mutase